MDIGASVFLATFVAAAILGAVVQRTDFCTMGAVSDWVNMGSTGRMRSWLLAIGVAMLGAGALEAFGILNLDDSRIPYRSATFAWPRYLLGGALFGLGMTLASGCTNKNLVRLGGGNLKSLVVLVIVAFCGYLMTRTDFYGIVFHSWMMPISIDLEQHGFSSQSASSILATVAGSEAGPGWQAWVGVVVALALIGLSFANAQFRANHEQVVAGAVVGVCVAAAWYITGGSLGLAWQEAADFAELPPPSVGMQSFTFVAPAADVLVYLNAGFDSNLVTFGIAAVAGVVVGAFLHALVTGRWRFEWFNSLSDFLRHVVGAAFMGIGGVLALGCTVGQGITGLSTLAVGSILAVVAIVFSSALTMKVQYYGLLYEESGWLDRLVASLADMRLLPAAMRKLEAV